MALYGVNLAGAIFHRGYIHKTEQHIPPNVPHMHVNFAVCQWSSEYNRELEGADYNRSQ